MRTDQNIGPARQHRSNVHSASVTTILLGERKRDDFETYSSTPDQTRLNHTIKLCTQKTMETWLENVKEYPSTIFQSIVLAYIHFLLAVFAS